jgi:diphthamide synthase subunit DPH2
MTFIQDVTSQFISADALLKSRISKIMVVDMGEGLHYSLILKGQNGRARFNTINELVDYLNDNGLV